MGSQGPRTDFVIITQICETNSIAIKKNPSQASTIRRSVHREQLREFSSTSSISPLNIITHPRHGALTPLFVEGFQPAG